MRDSKNLSGESSASDTFQLLGLGYVEIDEQGRLTVANAQAFSLCNLSQSDFGPAPADFFPEWSDGLFRRAYERALSGESGRLQDYCGSLERHFEARFCPRSEGGVTILFEDTGPLRRQESLARRESLANLSHDIRSPIAAILGYVDILSREIKDGDQLDFLKIIARNGLSVLDILNESLDRSKIEADNGPGGRCRGDTGPSLLQRTTVLLVGGNSDLQNLFGSGLREAGATVVSGRDGQWALNYLHNNRADIVLLDMQPGTDSYAAARELRGRHHFLPILGVTRANDAQACVEAGCTGHIAWPVDQVSLTTRVAELLVGSKRLRVLVVEDNILVAAGTRAVLNSLGCETVVAYDAKQALAEVHRGSQFDLTLIDLGLPDMDGGALLAKLKEVPCLGKTRFIAHTGDEPDAVTEVFGRRFDDVLQKPVERERLLRLLLA